VYGRSGLAISFLP